MRYSLKNFGSDINHLFMYACAYFLIIVPTIVFAVDLFPEVSYNIIALSLSSDWHLFN